MFLHDYRLVCEISTVRTLALIDLDDQIERQTDRHIYNQADISLQDMMQCKWRVKRAHDMYLPSDNQTDRQTDRQTNKLTQNVLSSTLWDHTCQWCGFCDSYDILRILSGVWTPVLIEIGQDAIIWDTLICKALMSPVIVKEPFISNLFIQQLIRTLHLCRVPKHSVIDSFLVFLLV